MNYNYSNSLNNHPYANTSYQQKNKIPQSVLITHNNTPRKQTLIRNQSFQNRKYNDDLIQLIAKIRSLQDDLINQRFKNQTLQRKIMQYQKIIQSMEYEFTAQNYQVQKYRHQLQLSNQKNIQILKYEENLKLVGQQIQELNNVLVLKNKQYESMMQKNKSLEFQIKKIQQDNHLLKFNQSIWKKQLDAVLEQTSGILIELKENSVLNGSNSNNRANILKQANSVPSDSNFRNFLSPQKQNPKNLHQSNRQNSLSFNNNTHNFSQQMSKRIQIMRQFFIDLSAQYKTLSKEYQTSKKDLCIAFNKQKQKSIKLEYEYKLQQQRIKDLNRKPSLIKTAQNQQKIQQIIQQMLKKQDEYIARIQQLTKQNQSNKQTIAELQSGQEYIQSIELKQKKSMIQSLLRQKKIFQQEILELNQRLREQENKFNQVIMISQRDSNLEEKNTIMLNKKIRRVEEENIELKIKIDQLTGEIKLLNKEIYILKGQGEDQFLEQDRVEGNSQFQETNRKNQ